MSDCYVSYKKKDLIKTGEYLLDQTCCDEPTCTELAKDLQDLQYKCNDMFGEIHKLEADAKGNIKGTLCDQLKNKKNIILEQHGGGRKKIKRQTKRKNPKKSKKNIKKSKKYRRSKK
jgi:hypothetical protein